MKINRNRAKPVEEGDLTPMIDMTFQLIAFFMVLINKSRIREFLDGLNLGEDLAMELERETDKALKKAVERAKANGRRTVYARDL